MTPLLCPKLCWHNLHVLNAHAHAHAHARAHAHTHTSTKSLLLHIILNAVPSGPPRNVSATFISSTSFSLSWTPPEEESRNGMIRSYVVNLTDTSDGTTRVVTTTGASNRVTISGLEPFTMYSVVVAAHTIAIGPFSATVQLMTLEDGEFYNILTRSLFF